MRQTNIFDYIYFTLLLVMVIPLVVIIWAFALILWSAYHICKLIDPKQHNFYAEAFRDFAH